MKEDISQNNEPEVEHDDDVIVVSKSLFVGIIVGIVALLVGGVGGFFLGQTVATSRMEAEIARAQLAGGNNEQANVQPTQPPARLANVSVDNDPFLGNEDAAITIVEFSDFRCPYCQRFHLETLPQIMEAYGDQIRFVYRDFPVVGGQAAAEASECANAQGKYWEYHEALFENPQAFSSLDAFVSKAEELGMDAEAFQGCLENGTYRDEVIADYNDGRQYGVSGTPTFFINGVRVIGAQPFENFKAIIEEELANQ